MAKQKKYYVVWEGLDIGVFDTWEECRRNTQGYVGAKYKSFNTRNEALRALEDGYELYKQEHPHTSTYHTDFIFGKSEGDSTQDLSAINKPIPYALTVDAACSGNPGPVEYRGVLLNTRQEIFKVGPIEDGSNNIGEFLALVHGLALCKQKGWDIAIYSDSQTAISWVKNKRCKTLIKKTEKNQLLFDLVRRAENWLRSNTYSTHIYKWDTAQWGEIPADFGRK